MSILSSTKSGVKSLIKEWCDENRIFNGHYEINDKMEITTEYTKRDKMIFCHTRKNSVIFNKMREKNQYL